jgi:Bacterial Ig-like domain (group 3)/FG-GAP-like repeat
LAATLLVLLLLPLTAVAAPQPTTTSLNVAPNPATAGEVVTLTATVTSNGEPVAVGTVTFLSGKQVLAAVQVVQASGTATLKTRFAPGMFQLNAQYSANDLFQASQSGPQQLTVTGTELSLTTLTAQPDGNNFDFTASVFGFGLPVPTGQVKFSDLTDGFDLPTVALAGQGMSSFLPQQSHAAADQPRFVVTGDFNGDGIPDLAITEQSSNTVSVLLGNGNGTFQAQQQYPVGGSPQGMAVGDFNGDGILDLAVVNDSDNTVSVLLGNGDGTFQNQLINNTGFFPDIIATGDFNGDGILDFVVTNTASFTVSVWLGNGDGTFQPPPQYAVGNSPAGIAVGDFNGDGIADLAVVNTSDNSVSVLLGNGDGTFQAQKTYAVGGSPFDLTIADFKGNHVLDLAVTNNNDGTVSILLGNGDGTFQAQQTVNIQPNPFAITTADFNGDGIPDLAVTSLTGAVDVLLGKGDGSFQLPQTYPTGFLPLGIAAADLTGDGVPDLLTANTESNTVSILLGGSVTSAQLNNVPIIGSGIHGVQGNYAPDASSIYAASASNTVMVPAGGKATPPITLTGSPSPQSPVNYGNNEYFTALVQSPGGGTPTGTVNFMEDATLLGTASLVANASGQGSVANYTNNTLVIGQHLVTATYNGDGNFNSATSSPPVTVTVITPFMLIPQNGNSGTVSPGGKITFSVAVNAAWQDQPLIYAVMTCKSPAGTGITCSIACPPSPSKPPGLTNLCVLTQMTGTVATVTVDTGGTAHLVPPLHRDGERRVVAALMGLSGIGLVGLVLLPFRLRREAVGGVLFLVVVVLCFGTSCATSFAPGITSPPVNNTFYITVNAELREENPVASTGYNALGVQTFLYSLLIK